MQRGLLTGGNATLKGELARLEQILVDRQASVVPQLLPGLPADRIRTLTASFPPQLEPDLVELYSWHDGTSDSEWGVPELFPGGTFLGLEQSIAQYQIRVETARRVASPDHADELYDPSWFPLFLDAGGNLHVSATQPRALAGSIWFVPLDEPELRYTVASSLSKFIALIIELFERGAYVVESDGTVNADYRAVAAVMRQRVTPKPNVRALVADLRSDDSQQVLRAFDTLRRFLFPEAVEPLTEAIGSANPIVRRNAVLLLGMLGDNRAVIRALESALADEDASVRAAAISALGQRNG